MVAKVPWYTERTVTNISLGSIIVMVLVRTIQVNMAQIRVSVMYIGRGRGIVLAIGPGLHLQSRGKTGPKIVFWWSIIKGSAFHIWGSQERPNSEKGGLTP